jgi:hypothetical protein
VGPLRNQQSAMNARCMGIKRWDANFPEWYGSLSVEAQEPKLPELALQTDELS